jgi:hypothetical protein
VKSCNALAAQFDGASLTTVEGLQRELAETLAEQNGGVAGSLSPTQTHSPPRASRRRSSGSRCNGRGCR